MRNLFFALLFLNLAFFAWGYWVGPPMPGVAASPRGSAAAASPSTTSASASASAPPGVPLLELVPISPARSGSATRCRSIGPFAEASAASAAGEALRARGWQPRDRGVDTSVADGYWVYIGQLTAAAQRDVLARLNAAGIHDAASMTQPEQSDRVSVGFFSDQTHAVRRAEQVRALGFKPVLDLHQRTVITHWLDVDLKPTDPDLSAKQLQTSAALQVADCPTKGSGG